MEITILNATKNKEEYRHLVGNTFKVIDLLSTDDYYAVRNFNQVYLIKSCDAKIINTEKTYRMNCNNCRYDLGNNPKEHEFSRCDECYFFNNWEEN